MIIDMRESDAVYVCRNISNGHLTEWSNMHILGEEPNFKDLLAEHLINMPGIKHSLLVDDEPLCVAGLYVICPGVLSSWAVATGRVKIGISEYTRYSRRLIKSLMGNELLHRIQSLTLSNDKETHHWYRLMGFHHEATVPCWGRHGDDYQMFSVTK